MDLTEKVLDFWFGEIDLTKDLTAREIWFKSTLKFDQEIRELFFYDYKDALAGQLDHMKKTQNSCLAFIIILDQFSRNLFRGSPQAFAADSKAREATYHAINKRFDKEISRVAKLFFYLPLEHSEILADQKKSVKLHNLINEKKFSKAATEHYNTILRFGRFPHRNATLGRKNTPEEDVYLKNPKKWEKIGQ